MSLLLSLLALILGAVAVMLGLKPRREADGLARRLRELEDQVASQSSRIAAASRTPKAPPESTVRLERPSSSESTARPAPPPPSPSVGRPRSDFPAPPAEGPEGTEAASQPTGPTLRAEPAEPQDRDRRNADAEGRASALARSIRADQADDGDDSPAPASSGVNWEELIGLKLWIWLGAVAVALAGAFLVKLSIEQGLLGPAARTGIGFAFGLGLLVAAQFLYRRVERIAAALAAAGIADLYACTVAAVSLYALIPVPLAFALMVAITAAAVGLSLRHGQIVAVIALIGGFLTPGFLNVPDRQPATLFAYLFVLQAGLIVVTRYRGWWLLAVAALLGSMIWASVWLIAFDYDRWTGLWLGLFLLASVASVVMASNPTGERDPWGVHRFAAKLNWLAVVLGLILVAALVGVSDFSGLEWSFLGILAAGCIALGILRKVYDPLPWLAAAALLAMLGVWTIDRTPDRVDVFGWVCFGLGVLFVIGPYVGIWFAARPPRWAALAAVAAVAFTLTPYSAGLELPFGLPWWGLQFALAAALALLAVPVGRRLGMMEHAAECFAALLVGVTFLSALAFALAFHPDYPQLIAVAWAAQAPVLAALGSRLQIPALRKLAAAVTTTVLVRLVFNPGVLDWPIGDLPVLNALLYTYGLPIAALAAAAWIYRRYDRNQPTRELHFIEATGVLLAFVMTGLLVRHGAVVIRAEEAWTWSGVARSGLESWRFSAYEWSTYIVAWGGLALGLLTAWRWMRAPALHLGGLAVAAAAAATLAVGLIHFSPWYREISIGATAIFNGLLYLYGAPLAVAAMLAWQLRRVNQTPGGCVARIIVIGLLVVLVAHEVRHFFAGAAMHAGTPGLVELATHVIAGLLIGFGLDAWARWKSDPVAEHGTVALLSLSVIGAIGLLALWRNPLWNGEPVGTLPILNWLVYVYGLPAALTALAGWRLTKVDVHLRSSFGVAALLLLFVLISLLVRQAFQGPVLDGPEPSAAEWYAYSAAWVGLGIALLVAGIASAGRTLRYASLVVMLLAVGKVFLFDTRNLSDLYRVFSFLGLGLSLLLLAWLYQRFVFRRSSTARQTQPAS